MKTEKIAEKAREIFPLTKEAIQTIAEKAIPILTSTGAGKDWNLIDRLSYIKGATEINALWQEKVRWIPVDERLPEENKQYLVIQLNDMKTIFVGRFNTISKRWSLFGYHDHVTHWREIIE